MMTIATIGFDAALTSAMIFTAVVCTAVLNVFWLVAGIRYRGPVVRVIRALWIAYLAAPIFVAAAFAFSVQQHPLTYCPEPFGGDGRPIGYILGWVVLGTAISLIGVIIMAISGEWNTAEQATQPYSEPAARSPQG